jgi:hypothetical protein
VVARDQDHVALGLDDLLELDSEVIPLAGPIVVRLREPTVAL